jgi:flagellar hook-length control protein FliK
VQSTGNSSAAEVANALTPQVGTTDWEDALSQKVVFLSNAHSQSAELTLNPKDLGPLQVVLQVADNHAHALFVSQHQSVREAVEAALPKLREAMESNGIGLGSASVSDGFARQNGGQQNGDSGRSSGKSGGNGGSFAGGGASDSADTVANVAVRRKVGLVDTFA